jgi:hypothetical protein
MAVKTEANRLHDLLKWEQDNRYSREKVTVLSGENLTLGAVLGAVKSSTPTTGTADAGNTGNGTCTGVTAGAEVQIGTYTLECVAAATNAGTFKVVGPDGVALPDAEVAVAYTNEQLNFTLNDGSTDFAVGDIFTVAVAEGSGKVVEIDFAAVDGSEDAYGVLLADADASAADVAGVALVREALIVASALVWPTGATAGQKAAALAQLKAKGIVVRDEV